MSTNSAKTGGIVAGAGCLFGLAPLIVSLLAAAVGSNIGNTLHWYTFFTAPMGAIVVVVGLVMAIVATTKTQPEEFAATIMPGAKKQSAGGTESAGATSTPIELPPVPKGVARAVKIAYAVGFGVLLVSCILRVTLFQPMGGVLTVFDLLPAAFAGWFVLLARKAHIGLQFLRLHRSQMIVSIAGCFVGLYPLLFLEENISMLSDSGIDRFQWAGTIITGLIPMAASVASLVFAEVARSQYRSSIPRG